MTRDRIFAILKEVYLCTGIKDEFFDLATDKIFAESSDVINTAERLLMDSALKCPHCGGIGFTVHPNYHTGEPEQEQCRWCSDIEWFRSRMNSSEKPNSFKEGGDE